MTVTLMHIYHEDEDPGNITVNASLPINQPKYCLEIISLLDKVKSQTIQKLSEQNKEKMKDEKGFFYKILQVVGNKLSDKEKKELNKKIKEMEEAEKTGQGIQSTLNNLASALSKATGEDRKRMIRDINASIKNIVGGA